MTLTKQIAALVFAGLLFGASGCATSSNLSSDEQITKENVDEKLKDISVSADAKKLIAEETNEEVLREKLICKREKQIGTHFKKKVCRTQAEIDAMREASKRDTDAAQRIRDYESVN